MADLDQRIVKGTNRKDLRIASEASYSEAIHSEIQKYHGANRSAGPRLSPYLRRLSRM